MTGAIRTADPGRPITVGLHMEDLEDDRRIGPAEVARYCDVVSMHGYPAYTAWADGPTDDRLLPFLALLTRWLAGGAPVLFEEFGLPTGTPGRHRAGSAGRRETAPPPTPGRALDGLRRAGCIGALLWCFADYVPALHDRPPFDEALHERSFGLWRADGSAETGRRRDHRPGRPAPAGRPRANCRGWTSTSTSSSPIEPGNISPPVSTLLPGRDLHRIAGPKFLMPPKPALFVAFLSFLS